MSIAHYVTAFLQLSLKLKTLQLLIEKQHKIVVLIAYWDIF